VFARYGRVCVHCGAPATDVDHLVPIADGGDDSLANLSSKPERIESEIKGATNPWMPLIPVELPNGESAMVNAAQIRVIRPACARCNRGRR
jgi:5-methylcytosine-specific restriction endonuclease McrA